MYFNTFRRNLSSNNNALPFFGFHNEVGNLINTILAEHINKDESELNSEVWFRPKIDIMESKTHYIITSELAGVEQKNIDISLDKNILTITGEKKKSEIDSETKIHKNEINYGKFKRVIEFPQQANSDGIEAELKEGILTIKIEKYTQPEPKKITIKTA